MTLVELQPYLTALSAGLSVASLGLILNLAKAFRDAAQDRIAVQEERLKSAADDHTRLKEWSEREKTELKIQLDQAKVQIDALLKKEGLDASSLIAGKRLSESASEMQSTVTRLTEEMRLTLSKLSESNQQVGPNTANAVRTLAMAAMATGHYQDAADQYDVLLASGTAKWEDHMSRGVAHANARRGRGSDLAALMAYNDAIALAPRDLEANRRARLFTYRAAMLKRLRRLHEAENDLGISLSEATAEYEKLDAHYNLACIYAMQSNPDKMYEQVSALRESPRFLAIVRRNLDEYFSNYSSDARLLSLLSPTR